MAKFIPVRCSGNLSNVPVKDGQMLVDSRYGTMFFDKSDARSCLMYVHGIFRNISLNTWIYDKGRYYINATDLAAQSIPDGYTVVGASLLSGALQSTISTDGVVKIYSNDRCSGSVLIFTMPIDSIDDSVLQDLIALYHFEEPSKEFIDSTGTSQIQPNSMCTFDTTHKHGSGSVCKGSGGSLSVTNLPHMSAFTIEWWQYDLQAKGDGGILLSWNNGVDITMPTIDASSSKYKAKEWKHIAVSKSVDGPVSVYVNGDLIGFSTVDSEITEYADGFTLYGSMSETGGAKVCYIDELAVFNYARYHESFTPPAEYYVAFNEAVIAVNNDVLINALPGEEVTFDLPVSTSTGAAVDFDLSTISLFENVEQDGYTITATITDKSSGVYYLPVRHPGSVSKVVKIIFTRSTDVAEQNSTDIAYVGDTMYTTDTTATGSDREWVQGSDDTAITVAYDESDSGDTYTLENYEAEFGNRIWSN